MQSPSAGVVSLHPPEHIQPPRPDGRRQRGRENEVAAAIDHVLSQKPRPADVCDHAAESFAPGVHGREDTLPQAERIDTARARRPVTPGRMRFIYDDVRAGGSEMLRLEAVTVPPAQSLSDYLASGWMENLDPRSIVETSVNGLAAATASAEGSQWSFRIVVLRIDTSAVRLIFAAKPGTRELDRTFQELAGTFRPISASEIAATKPLRLRVIAVQPGETPDKLARRMAAVDRPLERFLVLNGLAAGQALKAGDRVKIVTNDGHIRPPVK